MNTIAYIKDLVKEYYKGYPWFSVDEKEISIEDFIIINLEEKEYEEKSMGQIYGNGKAY